MRAIKKILRRVMDVVSGRVIGRPAIDSSLVTVPFTKILRLHKIVANMAISKKDM